MVKTPAQPFIETPLEDGVYYRRIARPYFDDPPDSIGWNPEDEEQSTHHRKTLIVAENAGQLHHLKEHLEQIAKVVYPRGQNLAAFGHEIRNVLIIACTEVEAQWHGVMKANGFCFPKRNGEDRGATHHYAKLLEPLKLNEYCVRFPYFPEIEPIFPFKKWEASDPTQTLDWYAAYNNVKHDREKNFGEAKLIYALTAAAAYFIMLCAQHGREIAAPPEKARTKFFCLASWPSWEKDYCYKPIKRGNDRVFNKCKKLWPEDSSKLLEERSDLVLAKEQKLDPAIFT